MLSSQRKQQILALLKAENQVISSELSQRFNVSEDSIRRDLRELSHEGLLHRVHGGALPASAAIAPLNTRKNVQNSSKKRVAYKAIELIQSDQIVMIDGGTTTEEMVHLLPKDLSFTAITHSPNIAVALMSFPKVEVITLGGQLFRHSMVAVGASVLESASRISADLFFMGVTGVHPTVGLTTGNYEEAAVKRALAAQAADVIVMVSNEKLNSASAFVIGDLSLASTLIIDGKPDKDICQILKKKQVTVL